MVREIVISPYRSFRFFELPPDKSGGGAVFVLVPIGLRGSQGTCGRLCPLFTREDPPWLPPVTVSRLKPGNGNPIQAG